MIPEEESGFSGQAEATLYKKAQGGCQESLNELMARHEGLVRWVAQHQWLLTLPYEEALQAGRQGLWRAILGYDVGRGITFSTYAYPERGTGVEGEPAGPGETSAQTVARGHPRLLRFTEEKGAHDAASHRRRNGDKR